MLSLLTLMNNLSIQLTVKNSFNSDNVNDFKNNECSILLLHLPDIILKEIEEYLLEPKMITTKNNLKKVGFELINYYLSFKNFMIIKKNINSLKEKHRLISKYYRYNQYYEDNVLSNKISIYKKRNISKQNLSKQNLSKQNSHPLLLDILFSGCNLPRAQSTFDQFTKEQEIDFKLAIELFHDSIYSNYGELRCRHSVTPLQAACFNEHVPINIIEIILKVDKSLIDIPVLVNGEKVNIIDDLEDNNNIFRVNSIRELFSKYST